MQYICNIAAEEKFHVHSSTKALRMETCQKPWNCFWNKQQTAQSSPLCQIGIVYMVTFVCTHRDVDRCHYISAEKEQRELLQRKVEGVDSNNIQWYCWLPFIACLLISKNHITCFTRTKSSISISLWLQLRTLWLSHCHTASRWWSFHLDLTPKPRFLTTIL